jgi:hypothetical protein
VHPSTNLTANKQITVQETGHMCVPGTKSYTAKGTATKKKKNQVSSTLPFMMIAAGLQIGSPFAS